MSKHELLSRLLPALGQASSLPGKPVVLKLNSKEETEDVQHLLSGLRDLSNCFKYDTKAKGTILTITATEEEDG